MKMHEVQLVLEGTGVAPDTVRLGELAELLSGIESTVSSYFAARGVALPDDVGMSLVDIFPGSEGLTLKVPEQHLDVLRLVSASIERKEWDVLPIQTRSVLRSLARKLARQGRDLRFLENESLGIYPAGLGASFEAPIVETSRVSGTTTIHARCLRVGGVKPRAELRLPNQERLLYADLTEDLAKELAERLYEEVALEGSATWDAESWEIQSFRVSRLTQYRKTDPVLAFQELAEAADGHWDDTDAADYVRGLRGEGG